MARRRKRRRGRVLRILWRHRLSICVVFLLTGLGVLYWRSIHYLEAHAARIALIQAALEEAQNDPDVGRFIALRRELEIVKVEPLFWGLGVIMLLSFGAVLLALIIHSSSGNIDHNRSAKIWEGIMQEKRQERRRSRSS